MVNMISSLSETLRKLRDLDLAANISKSKRKRLRKRAKQTQWLVNDRVQPLKQSEGFASNPAVKIQTEGASIPTGYDTALEMDIGCLYRVEEKCGISQPTHFYQSTLIDDATENRSPISSIQESKQGNMENLLDCSPKFPGFRKWIGKNFAV